MPYINQDGAVSGADQGNCTIGTTGTYPYTITFGSSAYADGFTCSIPSFDSSGDVVWSQPAANGQPVTVSTQTLCVSLAAFRPDSYVEVVDAQDLQPQYAYWYWWLIPVETPWQNASGSIGCDYHCVVIEALCTYGSCTSDPGCSSGYYCDTTAGCCEPSGGGGGTGDGGQCSGPGEFGLGTDGMSCDYPGEFDDECSTYYCGTDGCCDYYDPIIIDVEGDGYSLTSPQDGVLFDITGRGQRTRSSWTSMDADDAFLALDRNGNGVIDDGSELFSNFSPNAGPAGKQSGYTALAFYDRPENGGNGDGWITKTTPSTAKLLLWVDKNHNGISEPDELFTLPQLGITRVSLNYHQSKWADAYGNVFRNRAQVVRGDSNGPGRITGPTTYSCTECSS